MIQAAGAKEPGIISERETARAAIAATGLCARAPGMDGYEVARRVRGGFPERRTALVALIGWCQEEDRRKAREAGFDHHLVKPAEISALHSSSRCSPRRP